MARLSTSSRRILPLDEKVLLGTAELSVSNPTASELGYICTGPSDNINRALGDSIDLVRRIRAQQPSKGQQTMHAT